jgi:hypothetical protein
VKSIYERNKEELVDGVSSAPGRPVTYLLNPKEGNTPHSCTRYEWNGDLADMLVFSTRALKGGSGVKITFPANTELRNTIDDVGDPFDDWNVYIDSSHQEYEAISGRHNFIKKADLNKESLKIFKVADSIEGLGGILYSWTVLTSFWSWKNVVLDLSNIRPAGTMNSNGLRASGAESFLTIYEALALYMADGAIESLVKLLGVLNAVIRRGGKKKGIITSTMDSRSPLIEDYLNIPIVEIEGSHKKGVILHKSALDYPQLVDAIIRSRNEDSTFIEKPSGKGLGFNVCMGLVLGHKATCLIWRVNLGKCEVMGICDAFVQAALDLCELHTTWRERLPELAAYYAPLELDRQIGLDVMGLANLLAIEGVTYREFADALDHLLNGTPTVTTEKAHLIASQLIMAYAKATQVCDDYMKKKNLPRLDRIFTVEPAQSHSYETTDRLGKTICRGIFAPTGRVVNRSSQAQANKRYFHGSVETDVMVGADLHERSCDLWQQMMDNTGRSHGISQDSWSEMTVKKLTELLDRPSKTLYYPEAANFNQRSFLSKKVQPVDVVEFSTEGSTEEVYHIPREGECMSCAG